MNERILQLAGYGDDLTRATILLAQEFNDAHSVQDLKDLSQFAGRKAKLLAQIPTTFPTEWERELDQFEMLTMYELMRLPQDQRAVLAKEWRDKTLSWGDVRERVGELKQRKPKESKAKEVLSDKQLNVVINTLEDCASEYDASFGLPVSDETWVSGTKVKLIEALREIK